MIIASWLDNSWILLNSALKSRFFLGETPSMILKEPAFST